MTNTSSTSGRRVLIASAFLQMAHRQEIAWKRAFPEDRVSFVLVSPMGAVHQDIPRDLPISQTPRVSQPIWRLNTSHDTKYSTFLMEASWEPSIVSRADLPIALEGFDLFVCGVGDERRELFNFVNLLRFHDMRVTDGILYWGAPRWESSDFFESSLKEMRPITSPDLVDWVSREECLRHFRFNYNLNAYPIFGILSQRVGVPKRYSVRDQVWQDQNYVSYDALRVVQHLVHSAIECIEEGEFLCLLRDWSGSGKYRSCGIEHPATRSLVMVEMMKRGFLTYAPRIFDPKVSIVSTHHATLEASQELLVVTDLARDFVGQLHRSMWDPDLLGRLAVWEDEWPASKPKIDRYLRTMWGRQKRAL